jgi:hypothetical protein
MPAPKYDLLKLLVPDPEEWPVFIETGTLRGETIFAMEPWFDELHTIELGKDLWSRVKGRYRGEKIRFHHGDSPTVLRELLPAITRRAIFFLDGHWSCGVTARGEQDVPLLDEIRVITRCFTHEALLVIDDLRLFGQGPETGEAVDWTKVGIPGVREAAGERLILLEERRDLDKLVVRLAADPGGGDAAE